MDTNEFQSHILKELSELKTLFLKNEEDHGKLSTKVETVRTEVETVRTEVETFKSDIRKDLNLHLKWNIGTIIGVGILIVTIFKLLPN